MYTSILLALGGALAGQPAPQSSPVWMTDYSQALTRAKKETRPLAVFVASGQAGYNQVSRAGTLSPRAREVLAKHYVCVYLDASQPAARRLADILEITDRGLVVSDRTGQVQAFHHNGDLSDADLIRRLERFATVTNVRTTESNGTSRVSYYPANGGAAPASFVPATGFGGGRAC